MNREIKKCAFVAFVFFMIGINGALIIYDDALQCEKDRLATECKGYIYKWKRLLFL